MKIIKIGEKGKMISCIICQVRKEAARVLMSLYLFPLIHLCNVFTLILRYTCAHSECFAKQNVSKNRAGSQDERSNHCPLQLQII